MNKKTEHHSLKFYQYIISSVIVVTEGVSNLDALGVRSICLSVRAGLQGFVEMVDGLTGGIFHRQQTIICHPATIKGLDL